MQAKFTVTPPGTNNKATSPFTILPKDRNATPSDWTGHLDCCRKPGRFPSVHLWATLRFADCQPPAISAIHSPLIYRLGKFASSISMPYQQEHPGRKPYLFPSRSSNL